MCKNLYPHITITPKNQKNTCLIYIVNCKTNNITLDLNIYLLNIFYIFIYNLICLGTEQMEGNCKILVPFYFVLDIQNEDK